MIESNGREGTERAGINMKSRISMPEQLAQEFKRRIAAGIYAANSFLPSERELAKEFDTSRDTVAAALSVLTADGLAERCRGRGTRILAWPETHGKAIGCLAGGPFRINWPENLRVFDGIRQTLSKLGHKYELIGTEINSSSSGRTWPPLTTDEIMKRYKGVIYLESMDCDEQILELHGKGFPVVVANLEVDLDVPCTKVNHIKTSIQAVHILAGMGHSRIAYIGRDASAYFYGKAIEGYCIGLEECGIAYDESLLATVDDTSPLMAYIRARELLMQPNPPTALVAARDLFAEGACQAIREAGLVIGRDFSVIGYDDITWSQDEPFLTTFREPCYELGAVAAEIFLERLLGGSQEIEKREIESELIFRKSAGPLF
jgi:DNA-binding LacI/PurR family transcriptional regulator